MKGVLLIRLTFVYVVGIQCVLQNNCVYLCILKVVYHLTKPMFVFVIGIQCVFQNNYVYLCMLKVVSS